MCEMNEDAAQQPRIDRELTAEERELTRWMLENGTPEATEFLEQLKHARACGICPCGCASINFKIEGLEESTGGLSILGDFIFGEREELAGVFVFEQDRILAGIEVYGLAGDAPRHLPRSSQLRPFQ